LGYDSIFKPQEDNREVCPHMELLTIFPFRWNHRTEENLGTLIKAFSLYKEETKKDTKLVIIGQIGWKSNELLDQINSHPLKMKFLFWDMFLGRIYQLSIVCSSGDYYAFFFMRIWNDDTGLLRVEQPVLFQISQVYQKWGMLH
jgi:hypothetical protein